jgi:tetratricopeptide (TPR) repeat protein
VTLSQHSDSPLRPAPKPLPRKERLEELLALAQTYRGCTRREVAESLGRDPHKLIPESGIPKLDLVMRLAELLDWSVDQVARDLCDDSGTPVEPPGLSEAGLDAGPDFKTLDRAAFDAYERGEFDEVERLALDAYRAAQTPDERSRSLMRQCAAHDARGLYAKALEAAQHGLRETGASLEYHLSFRVNLANGHYTLGNLYEAEALANSLVGWFLANPMPSPLSQSTKAFALYVRGSCHRCFAGLLTPKALWHAQRAQEDLASAEGLFTAYAEKTGRATYAGYANICRGAALEVAPLVGTQSPDEALATITSALEELQSPEQMPRGAWLESWGWWCVFGCNVALRQIQDTSRLQALMAEFVRKADAIAEALGNWALRERVWSLELERRKGSGAALAEEEWVLKREAVRVVAGTMARFPVFRETGWQVLRSSRRAAE